MTAKQWRIGLVGVGRGSGYGRLFSARPDCDVVACCDVSADAVARFQRDLDLDDSQSFTRFEDLLAHGLDIVFLGTPIPYHADQTVLALEAGVHVLSEVTAARTVEGCHRIVDAVRRTGRSYMLAENCVYWPFIQDMKGIVQSGRLGQIVHAECEYVHPIPELLIEPATGKKLWRNERPPLHYCTHSLGPILQMMQDRVVRAMGIGRRNLICPDTGVGGVDMQVGLFETAGGATIKLLRSSVAPREPRMHYYSLQGTKGFVETDRLGPGGKGLLYVADEMKTAEEMVLSYVDESLPEWAASGGHGTAEYSLANAFLAALAAGQKPPIDEVAGFEMTVPGLLAQESVGQGNRWIDVPQVRA